MTTSENDICIIFKCQGHNKKNRFLTETTNGSLRELHIAIPRENIGINEKLSLKSLCKAHFQRCSNPTHRTYNLSVQFDNSSKSTLKINCTTLDDNVCHVQVAECNVRLSSAVKIVADKITTGPKKLVCDGRLILDSKLENRIQSKLRCQYISLSSGTEVRLSSESNVQSNCLHISAKTVFVDGKVSFLFSDTQLSYPTATPNLLEIVIDGDLHVGRDGIIGQENQYKQNNLITDNINLVISGNISNFGKILSANQIKIKCNTLLSCMINKGIRDTAHLFYNAVLNQLNDETNDERNETNDERNGTGTGIKDAIKKGDSKIIDYILKLRADCNDLSDGETPTQMAKRLCAQAFSNEKRNRNVKGRMKEDVSNIVINAWNKRFGSIISPTIMCEMSGDLCDLNQFSCNEILLRVQGNVFIDELSTCTLGFISGYCKGKTRISGSLKIQGFKNYETRVFQITDSGIVVLGQGGEILVTEHFINNSIIWNYKDSLSLTTGVFEQGNESLFKSDGNLNLSIQTTSTDFRGYIEADSVTFRIGALVVAECCIQAIRKCTFEIQKVEKQFCNNRIHFKGLVEVKEKPLEVTSQFLDKSSEADVTFHNEVIARGLCANNAFVIVKSTSIATIYPYAENLGEFENQPSNPQNPWQIMFKAGKLLTEVRSKVKFICGDKDTTIRITCRHSLKHYGTMVIENTTNTHNLVNIETAWLEYSGEIQNIGQLELAVSDKMIIRANLIAQETILITGRGKIQNFSSIKCTHGPIQIHESVHMLNSKNAVLEGEQLDIIISPNVSSIERKHDVRNKGVIKSSGSILIDGRNIDNQGRIESLNSTVEFHWRGQIKTTTELRGTVISPNRIACFIHEASIFHFKCCGGNKDSQSSFNLPKLGMSVECYKGSVILHTCIEGDADLNIETRKGLCVLKNINVPRLFISCNADLTRCISDETTRDKFDNNKNDELLSYDDISDVSYFTRLFQAMSKMVDVDQKIFESNASFHISNESYVRVREIISRTNQEKMNLFVQTTKESELLVEEKFLHGSSLVLDGSLSLSQSTELIAKKIRFSEGSICKITSKTEKIQQLCLLFADGDISLLGRVYHTGRGLFRVESENGDVCIKGNVSLPELLIISGQRMGVSIKSQMDIQGDIRIARPDEITVFAQSRINCTAIGYHQVSEDDDDKTVRITLDGYVDVNGPLEFENVNEITMKGVLKARGISASTANVQMKEKSFTYLSPIDMSVQEKNMNICSLGNLSTEKNSIITFQSIRNTTNYLHISTWEHKGILEVDGTSDEYNQMEVFVNDLKNLGEIKNIDSLLIEIYSLFSNHSNLFVRNTMNLKGKGNVRNYAILQCKEGACKFEEINTLENNKNGQIRGSSLLCIITQLHNHGMMTCNHDVQIKTQCVKNTGIIESLNSVVNIECTLKEENGMDVVTRQTQLIPQRVFDNACPGEIENNNTGQIRGSSRLYITAQLRIHNQGKITCKRDVLVKTDYVESSGIIESLYSKVNIQYDTKREASIDGEVKSPLQVNLILPNAEMFSCSCTLGYGNYDRTLVIPKNGFNIECPKGTIVFETDIDTGNEPRAMLNVVCCQICTIKSTVTAKTFCLQMPNTNVGSESDAEFSDKHPNQLLIKLEDDSKLVTELFVMSSYDETIPFCMLTNGSSYVSCYKKIQVNTGFIVKGQLRMLSSCTLLARGLNLEESSTCTILNPCSCGFDNETKTMEKPNCTIHVENDIQFLGNLIYEHHDKCMIFLASKNGNVIINGTMEISYLTVMARKDVIIGSNAVVKCQAFACKSSDTTTEKQQCLVINGNLQVSGPLHIVIDTVHLTKEGTLSISSEAEANNVVFEANQSVIIEGFYHCNIVGYCFFESNGFISFAKKCRCVISAKESNFMAYKMISMDKSCKIELIAGKLHLTNAKENDRTVHGKIHLNGIITVPDPFYNIEKYVGVGNATEPMLEIEGQEVKLDSIEIQQLKIVDIFAAMSFVIESNSIIKAVEKIEVQATDIEIYGRIGEMKRLELIAENTFVVGQTGMLHDGDNFKMLTTCSEIKGTIHCFKQMHLSLLNLLVLGEVDLIEEIKIEADTAFINTGRLQGIKTGIVAPIVMNCPSDSDVVFIPKLGGDNQKELIIEGLLCISIGTYIQAVSIDIKSVLNFQFSSQKTTIPKRDALDRWKLIVDSSLKNLNSTNSHTDIENLVKEAMKIPRVLCNLSASSHLCKDILQLSQNIRSGGLNAFKMDDLINSLQNAHNFYSDVSLLQVVKKDVRMKFRSFKKRCETVARKFINTLFGPNSFSCSLEFQNTDIKQGIRLTSFLHEGDKASETVSGGAYTAITMQFNGVGGSWKDGGHLEACGDIHISASIIKHTGGRDRLLRAIAGSVKLKGDSIIMHGVQSKYLDIQATKDVDVKSTDVHCDAQINANNTNIQSITAGGLNVKAENIQLESANVEKGINLHADDSIVTKHTTSKSLIADGKSSVDIKQCNVSENLTARADVAEGVHVKADGNISADDVKSKEMILQSNCGNVSLDGKIKAGKAHIEASKGSITLTGENGKAQHEFGSLNLTASNIKDIENILNQSDVYRDLKISDHLGLFVEDQDVILANKTKSQFSITLKAASVDVRGDIEAKAMTLEATKGTIKTWKNVHIKTKESLSMKARKDLIFSEGSSVEAGTDVSLHSTTESVKTFATNINAGQSIIIDANKDIEITSTDSSGPSRKSTIHAGNSESTSHDAITMNAGNDIKIHASDVSSQGKNSFQAGNDILITAHTYDTTHTEYKSSWFGLKTTTITTTTTHVDKPKICGNKNVFKAGRNFKSIAGQINSEFGTNIHAKGKVVMSDIVSTTRVETTTKVLGGILGYSNSVQKNESSHGTVLEDASSQAKTSITSETSDIKWMGSSIRTAGDFKETARRGKVKHNNRILNHTYEESGYGFFVKKTNDSSAQGEGFTLGFNYHSKQKSYQDTSNGEIAVGRSYEVTAGGFEALNAVDIDVKQDMSIDAERIRIEGAELQADEKSFQVGLSLNKTDASLDFQYNEGHKTTHQSLNLQTGGYLKLNSKHVKCVDLSADVGSLKGNIGNMEVITRANSESKTGFELNLGVDLITRTPSGKIDVDYLSSKTVDKSSAWNIRDGSKGLDIEKLSFTGASLVFDGDVHEFAGKVVSQEVHETFNQVNFGLSGSKKKACIEAKVTLGAKCSWGRYGSCIASVNGTVDESISKQINTNLNKQRQEDGSFQLSVSHEFKGSLSKNISSIGKSLGKAVRKEALAVCAKRLAQELGLDTEIINQILTIQKDGLTKKNIVRFVTSHLGKGVFPSGLMEALDELFINGNPTKLILWISGKANMDRNLLCAVIDILHNKRISKEAMQIIISCSVKYFRLSEEFRLIILSCLNLNEEMNLKRTGQHTLVALVNCPEGQKVFEGICKLLDIKGQTAETICMLLKQNNTDKGLFLIEMIGKQLGISTAVLDVLKEVILTNDSKKLIQYVCNQLGFDCTLTSVLVKTITASKNLKSLAFDLMKDLSNYFGITNEVRSYLQSLIIGKQIDGKGLFLLLQILKSCMGKQLPTELNDLIERIIPYIKSPNDMVESIISFEQQTIIGNGQTSGIQFVLFLCTLVGIPSDIVSAIECLLIKGNPTKLVSWLSTILYTVDKEIITCLVDIILDCSSFESTIKVVFQHYAGKNNASLTFQDLDNIIMRNVCYVEFETSFPPDFANFVISLRESGQPQQKLERCFYHLAVRCGVPEQLVNGLQEFVAVGKCEKISEYIGKQTGIPSPVVSFILDCVQGKKVDEMVNRLVDNPINSVDLSQLKGTIQRALQGKLCKIDIEKLVLQITRSLMPQVCKFMEEMKFPCEVIEKIEQLIWCGSKCDPHLLGFYFLEILAIVAGMPNEIVRCLKSVAIENDCGPLSIWISNLSGIEQGLVLLVVQTLKDGKRTMDGLVQLPLCIARYYKLSENTIAHLQCFLKGKIPKCGILDVILDITKDVCKHLEAFYPESIEVLISVFEAKDWVERSLNLLRYLASKFEVPIDIVDGFKDLLENKDASKLGMWLSERVGINKDIVVVLLNALIQKQNTKQIIRQFGRIAGIPDSAMAIIDELIQAHCSKHNISEFWTSGINWKPLCQSLTSVVKKEILEKQLGIPVELLDSTTGDASVENEITTFCSILGKIGIPAYFSDQLEDLIKNGDLRKFVSLICLQVNVNAKVPIAILETIQSKQSLFDKLIETVQIMAKMINISDEFLSIIENFARNSLDKNFKGKSELFNLILVLNTKEGQRFARQVGDMLEVPENVVDLILNFIAADSCMSKGFFLLQSLFSELGISNICIDDIKSILIENDPSPLMQWGFGKIGFETSLNMKLIKTLRDGENIAFVLSEIVKVVAIHFGISLDIVQSVERILKGQWPKHGTASLILKLLRDFGKSRCGRQFTNVIEQKFRALLSVAEVPDTVLKEMYSLSITPENAQNAAITIVVFLLNKAGISTEFVSKAERFLRKRDPDILMLFLAEGTNIDKDNTKELIDILMNGCDIKKLITYCLSSLRKKFNLSKTLSEDIELMFFGKSPKHELKDLVCILNSNQGDKMKELVDGFCRQREIRISVSKLIQLLCKTGAGKDNKEVFVLMACTCGFEKGFAKCIGSLVLNRNCVEFSVWIEDKTGFKRQWVIFILEMLLQRKFDKSLLANTIGHVLSLFGLRQTYIEEFSMMMNGDLSRNKVCTLLFRMSFEIITPELRKIAVTLNFPKGIIDAMVELFHFHEPKEFAISVTKILMEQAGMSSELFLAIKNAACYNEYNHIALWISEKSGIDKELILQIFQNISDEWNLTSLLREIPRSGAKYLKLSEKTIEFIECLMNGKLPDCSAAEAIAIIAKDVAKIPYIEENDDIFSALLEIISAGDGMQMTFQLLRYLSSKHGFPCTFFDGIYDLLQKNDCTKLAEIVSEKLKVDKSFILIVCNAFIQGETPKQIVKHLLDANEIPEVTIDVIEYLLKHIGTDVTTTVWNKELKLDKMLTPVKTATVWNKKSNLDRMLPPVKA